ncbi:MAG: hypothetical protein ACTSO7_04805 [Candidatus Heimdallarchaeota archaeon]
MSRYSLPKIKDKRAQKGLKKQLISVFSIIADEMGPHVEEIASPYMCDPLFNDREISILFTTVTMLEIKEMIMGELKLLFDITEYIMKDGRPSKKVLVAVCGVEASTNQIRNIVNNMIQSSNNAIKNLENLMER